MSKNKNWDTFRCLLANLGYDKKSWLECVYCLSKQELLDMFGIYETQEEMSKMSLREIYEKYPCAMEIILEQERNSL